VATVSPATGMALTSVKTAARLGKSYKFFTVGGFYNPCFYANSISAGLSATNFKFAMRSLYNVMQLSNSGGTFILCGSRLRSLGWFHWFNVKWHVHVILTLSKKITTNLFL
jgi:hypothetical protein